ncbi:MAG: hypothetical protein K9N62_09440 [Verrucomicrobia bacterium]|nr:hypothetical protein [Verrucomicrobiota bacterium]
MERICVIADDLTGAAELAGVGFRYGFEAEVERDAGSGRASSFLCLDTDSRSRPIAEVRERVRMAIDRAVGAGLIYKKVDSALRGNIVLELDAILTRLGLERALLVPANPSLQRLIRNGKYTIGGVPIDETGFRNDPDYPCRSASVLDILGTGSSPRPLHVCRPDEGLPSGGIIVGECGNREDLMAWAGRLDGSLLASGAAEFFTAILNQRGYSPSAQPMLEAGGEGVAEGSWASGPASGLRSLFVCGSASESTFRFLEEAGRMDVPILTMPSALRGPGVESGGAGANWLKEALDALDRHPCVLVGIGGPILPNPELGRRLTARLTDLVAGILEWRRIDSIYTEGGATAASLMDRMGWKQLRVVREFAQGVVALRPADERGPTVAMKPGSYTWPVSVRKILDSSARLD